MSALLKPVKGFVRSVDSAIGRVVGIGRVPAVLFDVHNGLGLEAQAPVIDHLVRSGRVQVDVASALLAATELSQRLAAHGIGRDHVVRPGAAAHRRYALVVITDSPTVRNWRRPPVAYLHHGSSFANLPSPYSLEFLVDGTARYLFCLCDAQVLHCRRLLGSSLGDRLIVTGQPKLDALARGGYDRAAYLGGLGLDPARKTVLLSSHWREEALFRSRDLEPLRDHLAALDVNVVVTAHHNLFSVERHQLSGGIDWLARLKRIFTGARMRVLSRLPDNQPLLAAADVLIGDHSSLHLEYATLYRPMIIYKRPDFAFSDPVMFELLQATATVVDSVEAMLRPVDEALNSGSVDPVARRRLLEYGLAWLGTSGRRTADVIEALVLPGAVRDIVVSPRA